MALRESSSSSVPLRVRKKESTRRALQEAALSLFNERGFSATSVDAIAAAAEVSRSTFFRYFGSKEAVLFDEMDSSAQRFVGFLLERPAEESPLEAYEEALVSLSDVTNGDTRRAERRLFGQLLADDPFVRQRHLHLLERWTSAIADAFATRGGRTEANLDDRLAAIVCVAASQQIGAEWVQPDAQASVAEAINDGFARVRALCAGT